MYKYDIALSYASEDESLVKNVYKMLARDGYTVFFAPEYQHVLVGRDLVAELRAIFNEECKCVVAFVSGHFISKSATMHEADTAMIRQKRDSRFLFLPIYMDTSRLPRLDQNIIYSKELNPDVIVDLIERAFGRPIAESTKEHFNETMDHESSNTTIMGGNNFGVIAGNHSSITINNKKD